MNQEFITAQVAECMLKHPGIEVLPPGSLTPEDTADSLIGLLKTMYVNHGITQHTEAVIEDLKNGNLQTWLAKKDGRLVATASLVKQTNGDVEIGRAVSLEKGNGKLLMLLAALAHLEHDTKSPLIAEVRVAKTFGGIPSGEATQHICFGILDLVPHAIAPFFSHGSPIRNESFILARSDISNRRTVSELAFEGISNRSTKGIIPRLKVVQAQPFHIIVPDENGQNFQDFESTQQNEESGFTLFPVETSDSNMPLIGALLGNSRIILCGIDGHSRNGKPVVLFGTIGPKTVIAPSQISTEIEQPLRRDLQDIADRFTSLGISEGSSY